MASKVMMILEVWRLHHLWRCCSILILAPVAVTKPDVSALMQCNTFTYTSSIFFVRSNSRQKRTKGRPCHQQQQFLWQHILVCPAAAAAHTSNTNNIMRRRVKGKSVVGGGGAAAAAADDEPTAVIVAENLDEAASEAKHVITTSRKKGTFRRLLSVAKPDRGTIAAAALALLVSSGTNMAFPTIMGKVIDRTAGAGGGDGSVPDKVRQFASSQALAVW